MRVTELRESVQRYGAKTIAKNFIARLKEAKVKDDILGGFSLREAWEVFIGPVDATMQRAMRGPGGLIGNPLIEDVNSWAFTAVTQAVLVAQVMAAYDDAPSVLDKLVSPYPSRNRTEKIVGFTTAGGIRTTPEGQEYARTGFTDRVTEAPEPEKRGFQIDITDEAVRFDRTGQIMIRARQAGDELKADREYYGMMAIQDQAACYAFYPHVAATPTQTTLYRTSAAGTAWYNKSVNAKSSNALVNWAQVQALWALWAAIKNESGNPILVQPRVLLVPNALVGNAQYAVNSTQSEMRGTAATATVQNWIVGNIADKVFGGQVEVVTSPHLDGVSAANWYLGDFKRQFVEQVVIPTEVREIPGNPSRDIVSSFVARRKSRVSACDDKFVLQGQG